MFKGLTHRAQRMLTVLAQDEAKRTRSDQVLPEHVFLAIIKEGEGIGFKALRSLKIDTLELRDELERSIESGARARSSETCPSRGDHVSFSKEPPRKPICRVRTT